MAERIPYSKRSDIDKIKSNWKKTKGLCNRKEWSGTIMRAATTAEIATNLAIREELQISRNLDTDFIDSLLLWANGIQGKFDRLLLPITKGTSRNKRFNRILKKVKEINKERNSIAHSGQFKNEKTARRIIVESKDIIETLVGEYKRAFNLTDIKKRRKKSTKK